MKKWNSGIWWKFWCFLSNPMLALALNRCPIFQRNGRFGTSSRLANLIMASNAIMEQPCLAIIGSAIGTSFPSRTVPYGELQNKVLHMFLLNYTGSNQGQIIILRKGREGQSKMKSGDKLSVFLQLQFLWPNYLGSNWMWAPIKQLL